MPGIALFVQDLSSFNPDRARGLQQRLLSEVGRGVEAVYALVWPDYQPPASPVPQANRRVFQQWRDQTGLPLWGWLNAQEAQASDAAWLARLTSELNPQGWLLDIEGRWTKGANLSVLIAGAKGTMRPVRASLAGASPAHVPYDWRTLDRNDVAVDWQAYFDSGEGCRPDVAVAEMYRTSFVIGGWEYRHQWKGKYGWGKVAGIWGGRARYDSYLVPNSPNANFGVTPAPWGWHPVDGSLEQNGEQVGLLMGRTRYALSRVTLDVTRGADQAHTLDEWTAIAASARVPGSAKRPVSVYLAENTTDDVIVAIAKGAP